MIYIKKENNEIKAFSEQKENTIAITEEEWTKSNYGVYCDIIDNKFTISKHVIDLEKLKKEKIKELKQNCQNYIYSVYPVYKQMNIINPLSDYSNEDRMIMNSFLDEQRAICDKKEKQINEAESREKLNMIVIDFEKVES